MSRQCAVVGGVHQVGRQQTEGRAVGIGADVASGLEVHERSMKAQYEEDEEHLQAVLVEAAAIQAETEEVVKLATSGGDHTVAAAAAALAAQYATPATPARPTLCLHRRHAR